LLIVDCYLIQAKGCDPQAGGGRKAQDALSRSFANTFSNQQPTNNNQQSAISNQQLTTSNQQ
jgi:hypothetical protein